jgi:predicted AAA+ superfamily ATPase
MYIPRKIDAYLENWQKSPERKPLLLRGARQVGKSSAIRHLAIGFTYFIEVNFEDQRQVISLFSGNLSAKQLGENLSVLYNTPVVAGETLLFFDEIQQCPDAISSLRFFYEQWPQLHVIAAGSLLEFALHELPSFGVGRIRSFFMYPFSFDEFLLALDEKALLKAKAKANADAPLKEAVHQKLNDYLKRFLVLGGMPEVVSAYIQGKSLIECQEILDDLIVSLQADFAKYHKRVPSLRLTEVFQSIVMQCGGKFIYNKAAQASHLQIKDALELLILAGLVIPVTHTAANGLPLGAESDPKKRKMILLDTGIYQRLSGLQLADVLFDSPVSLVNKGAIAELFAGLEILKFSSPMQPTVLYYWHREAQNSNAELDYIIQKGSQIVPIEVKSGTKGSMQSMFIFLREKKQPLGIRLSLEPFSSYELVQVVPLYAFSDYLKREK